MALAIPPEKRLHTRAQEVTRRGAKDLERATLAKNLRRNPEDLTEALMEVDFSGFFRPIIMTRAASRRPDAFISSRVPNTLGARRDEVYLFTDMAVMIDGLVRKAGSPP
jgi:hypothetical protein